MDIAVYVTAAVGGILLIFVGAFSSGGHRDWSIWASCLSAIFFVLSAFCWYQDKVWTDDAEAARAVKHEANVLVPGTGATPKSPADSSAPPGTETTLLLGDADFRFETFPLVVVAQGNEELIVLDKDESGLLFSGKFFDGNGKIICEIVKNTFHLNPNNYFRFDQTPSRLTIFDDEARQILDVDLINKNTMRLTGNFCIRGGDRLVR